MFHNFYLADDSKVSIFLDTRYRQSLLFVYSNRNCHPSFIIISYSFDVNQLDC